MLPRRLRVFVPATVVTVLGAAALVVLVALRFMVFTTDLLALGGSILAGPFAAWWVDPGLGGWLTIGVGNAAALVAHPAWPNRITGVITVLGFASWLFRGAAISFSGV